MNAKAENIVFCLAAVLLGLSLIYVVKAADNDVLKLLLLPHAKAVEIYYNMPMFYISGIGYSSAGSTFTIGRECMGCNFIVLIFTMNACMFTRYFNGFKKLIWVFTSLVGAAATGILISSIRIIASIPFVNHEKFVLLHSGLGISLYFAALVVSYISLNKLLGSDSHEGSC